MVIELRGKQVILDRNLANLYWVQTKHLKQAVRRNWNRFPIDFMFELSHEEFINWRSQFVTSNLEEDNNDTMWLRYAPFAFTEHGVLMLANILKSEQALHVSIEIVRYFVQLRQIVPVLEELKWMIHDLKLTTWEHDELIKQLCFDVQKLFHHSEEQNNREKRRKIWFQTK